MARVLLLLPSATYRAPEFLDAARRLGVDVVTASEQPQALASVMGDHFLEVDLEDVRAASEAIVALSGRLRLDAIVAADDAGVVVAATAAERLGLRHNPPGAVRATRDKVAMRRLLDAAGVEQPAWRAVPGRPAKHGSEADGVVTAASELGFPVVVKPSSLSASRGVIRADDATTAREVAARVRAIQLEAGAGDDEPLLVERFVPGVEVALEGLVSGGELEVLAVFDKPDPLDGPYFEETLYVTPSRLAADDLAGVCSLVARAVSAVGITEGPVHAEARLGPSGPVVVEVAARTIGGKCGRSLRFGPSDGDATSGAGTASGGRGEPDVTLEQVVLAHALGLEVPRRRTPDASGVMMIPVPSSGRLLAVGGVEAARAVRHVTGVDITVPAGRTVRAAPEGDRYLGFVFARAASPDEVERALREAHSLLEITIEPASS